MHMLVTRIPIFIPVTSLVAMSESSQLALAVHLRDEATLENFLFADAQLPLRSMLADQAGPAGEPALYLYGPAGSGRSHLLQAACHGLPAGQALYLPLDELQAMDPEAVFAGAEHLTLLAIDNLDAVIGRPEWELALFHLINRTRAADCRLLVSAAVAPRQLGVKLADLQSRLSWGVVFQLPAYSDSEKVEILQFRAGRRGMQLSDEAAHYILARAARSLADLIALLEQLDRASMVAQRQLSIPFIRATLGW